MIRCIHVCSMLKGRKSRVKSGIPFSTVKLLLYIRLTFKKSAKLDNRDPERWLVDSAQLHHNFEIWQIKLIIKLIKFSES